MSDVTTELAERVRNALAEKDRTIQWLAAELNEPFEPVRRKTVGKKYEFTFSEIVQIASLLEIAPHMLLPKAFTLHAQGEQTEVGRNCVHRSGVGATGPNSSTFSQK